MAVPPHRFTPLKDQWLKIYTPIVENMKLQIRMNLKTKRVELRVGGATQLPTPIESADDGGLPPWRFTLVGADVRVYRRSGRSAEGHRLCPRLYDGL